MSLLKSHIASFFHKTLVIDIETVPIVNQYNSLNKALQYQWGNKANNIRKYTEEQLTDEELFLQKGGIYAEFGKIICISIGRLVQQDERTALLRIKTYAQEEEKVLLESFFRDVLLFEKKDKPLIFCGHNIKEFDIPYICRRSLIHGLELPEAFRLSGAKPWNIPHIDTLELWRFGDYKHYVALDLLAAIFDISSSKTEMDGSMVSDEYWKKGNLKGIADYCSRDVVTTARVFLRMKGIHVDLQPEFIP